MKRLWIKIKMKWLLRQLKFYNWKMRHTRKLSKERHEAVKDYTLTLEKIKEVSDEAPNITSHSSRHSEWDL